MPTLRMFAQVREATGTGRADVPGGTVAEILAAARERYGSELGRLLPTCRIWVNGRPAAEGDSVKPTDEVALLPPVAGG